MRIVKEFGTYNFRRYGKPWIARVTNRPVGGKATLEFGTYNGDSGGGTCVIVAEPGDIVRWGQKDHRGRRTEAAWGIVTDVGGILDCTAAVAEAHYHRPKESAP